MWHRVEVVLTDVSKESIISIFRVEGRNASLTDALRADFLIFPLYPEDAGDTFLRNVG
jgi:hypothetical protein